MKQLFESWRKHLNEATDIDISVDPPAITTVDTPEPSGAGGSPTERIEGCGASG